MRLEELEKMSPIEIERVWADENFMHEIFGPIAFLELDELSKAYFVINNYNEQVRDYFYSYKLYAIVRNGRNIFYVTESSEGIDIYVYDTEAFDSFVSYVMREIHAEKYNIKFLNTDTQTNISNDLLSLRERYGEPW